MKGLLIAARILQVSTIYSGKCLAQAGLNQVRVCMCFVFPYEALGVWWWVGVQYNTVLNQI